MAYDPGLICVYENTDDLQHITDALTITSCTVSALSLAARSVNCEVSQFPANLAAQTTAVALLLSLAMLLSTILDYEQMDITYGWHHSVCLTQAMVFQFFAIALLWYWSFVGFVTYLVVVRRRSIRSIAFLERRFYLVCWPTCLMCTVFPLVFGGKAVYGPASGISVCYLASLVDQTRWFYGPMAVSVCVSTYFTVHIVIRLLQLARYAWPRKDARKYVRAESVSHVLTNARGRTDRTS